MEQITQQLTNLLKREQDQLLDNARRNATIITDEGEVERIGLTLNDYQTLSARTANEHDNEKVNYALGLTGEAGEFADLVKKEEFHGHSVNRDEKVKELGDVLWYLSQQARVNGITLEEVAQGNIDKLKARYPEGFSHEASKNRERSGE